MERPCDRYVIFSLYYTKCPLSLLNLDSLNVLQRVNTRSEAKARRMPSFGSACLLFDAVKIVVIFLGSSLLHRTSFLQTSFVGHPPLFIRHSPNIIQQ